VDNIDFTLYGLVPGGNAAEMFPNIWLIYVPYLSHVNHYRLNLVEYIWFSTSTCSFRGQNIMTQIVWLHHDSFSVCKQLACIIKLVVILAMFCKFCYDLNDIIHSLYIEDNAKSSSIPRNRTWHCQ